MRPKFALLPVGSFEQHGRYLPLATDTIVACAIARELAEAYPVLLLPPITISCSHEHAGWRGTVSISARTLHQVVTDIAESLALSGIDHLVLVSILLHIAPDAVRSGNETADWIQDDRQQLLTLGMRAYTTSGVIGRPSLGTAEKGAAALASLTKSFASTMRTLTDDRDD